MHYMTPMKQSSEMLAQCACTRARNVARLVTRAYDDILRPTGLKASQLAVLAAVDALEAPSIAALSKALFMDRTTLTRNLRPLVSAGLVASREQGRSKRTHLTSKGEATLRIALPLWRRAQGDFASRLGEARLEALEKHLRSVIAAY